MKNIFDGILDKNVAFIGTTQYGSAIAEKAAVGGAQTSVMTSEKQVAQVSNMKSADTPVIGMEGKKFAVPKSVTPAKTVRFGWNTDGETDDVVKNFIIDPKGLATAAGLTEDGTPTGGTLYSGTNNTIGQAKFDALSSIFCNKGFVFNSLRIVIKPSANAASGYVPSMDDLELRFVPVNEDFETGKVSTIHVGDHISPQQEHRDIVDIALTGTEQWVDGFITLKATGAKNTDYKFIFTTGLRV